MQWIDTSW